MPEDRRTTGIGLFLSLFVIVLSITSVSAQSGATLPTPIPTPPVWVIAIPTPTVTPIATPTPGPLTRFVNLMVLDKDNFRVNGVTANDVKLFVNDVEQKITSFSDVTDGATVVFVMDNTGSLRERLGQIITIGRLIVRNLGSEDEAMVIRFVGRDKIETEVPWTSDKQKLLDAMDNMYIEGGRYAVFDGIILSGEAAVARKTNARRTAVVVVTDGEDSGSYYNEKQLYEKLGASGLQVFPLILTLQWPGAKDSGLFPASTLRRQKIAAMAKRLAFLTGGQAYFLPNRSSEPEMLDDIRPLINELRSQFILGYVSTNETLGTYNLRVEITKDANGAIRKGIVKAAVEIPTK